MESLAQRGREVVVGGVAVGDEGIEAVDRAGRAPGGPVRGRAGAAARVGVRAAVVAGSAGGSALRAVGAVGRGADVVSVSTLVDPSSVPWTTRMAQRH